MSVKSRTETPNEILAKRVDTMCRSFAQEHDMAHYDVIDVLNVVMMNLVADLQGEALMVPDEDEDDSDPGDSPK